MSAPVTQVEIEDQIRRVAQRLEKLTQELRTLGQEAAEKRTAYDVAHAKALLLAEGTVAVKEAEATIQTADKLLEKRIAEALERSAQEAGRNHRAILDSLRSLNSNLRGAITNATGVGA